MKIDEMNGKFKHFVHQICDISASILGLPEMKKNSNMKNEKELKKKYKKKKIRKIIHVEL